MPLSNSRLRRSQAQQSSQPPNWEEKYKALERKMAKIEAEKKEAESKRASAERREYLADEEKKSALRAKKLAEEAKEEAEKGQKLAEERRIEAENDAKETITDLEAKLKAKEDEIKQLIANGPGVCKHLDTSTNLNVFCGQCYQE